MVGRLMLAVVALLATVGLAQSQDVKPKHHHKAPPVAEKAAAPAEKAAAPQEEPPLPEKVQKWFGNSVDDILTGAGKALDVDGKK